MFSKSIFAIASEALAVGFTAVAAEAADIFTLKSTTFADGKLMPKKVANTKENSNNNPNCVGDNVSPQFSWTNVPDGTKSLVFLMIDPEGRGGAGVNHWVAYGISPSVTGFAEGGEQTERQICRWQEHPRGSVLFRSVHAAQSNGASLYIRPDRHRSCAH